MNRAGVFAHLWGWWMLLFVVFFPPSLPSMRWEKTRASCCLGRDNEINFDSGVQMSPTDHTSVYLFRNLTGAVAMLSPACVFGQGHDQFPLWKTKFFTPYLHLNYYIKNIFPISNICNSKLDL